MNKHMLLIGGIGLAGIVILVIIMREHSAASASSQALPQLAESPASASPSYPAPPPLPPFTVNATPYYLTFNVPPNRNAALENAPVKKDSCCTDCEDAGTVVLRDSLLKRNASNARLAFQSGPNSGNMMVQFPPYLYPWLYQKGGTA